MRGITRPDTHACSRTLSAKHESQMTSSDGLSFIIKLSIGLLEKQLYVNDSFIIKIVADSFSADGL